MKGTSQVENGPLGCGARTPMMTPSRERRLCTGPGLQRRVSYRMLAGPMCIASGQCCIQPEAGHRSNKNVTSRVRTRLLQCVTSQDICQGVRGSLTVLPYIICN